MNERTLAPGTGGGLTRRQFARWVAGASAMLWSPKAMAEAKDAVMFLRPGDAYSDPKMLRKRYDRGGVELASYNMAGKALEWRILNDPFQAGAALGELLKSSAYRAAKWTAVAELVMTAEWLSNYPKFTQPMKTFIGDQLLKRVEVEGPLMGSDDPASSSFTRTAVENLALLMFAFVGGARLSPGNTKIGPLQVEMERSFRTLMTQMQFVAPDGGTHESMALMGGTFAPLAMMSEMRRSLTRDDTAEQISLFANMGHTYLYGMAPDGTVARGGDCEVFRIDGNDAMVLGYAVHRFQDRYAAWLLRHSDEVLRWTVPAMQFLWDNPSLFEADPFTASPKDLKLAKHFRGIDHVVFRNGFGKNQTRIEFGCGPYFARHQHLDRNHFTIQHRGHLAVDSGAAYHDGDSPHCLNYYRRTVAHNTMLVFDPAEKFVWADGTTAAANDGGQRMDSARYWESIRSVPYWQEARELWDVGRLRNVELGDPRYMYAMGDATKAYSAAKLTKFTREMLYFPSHDVLFVYDDVRSTKPELRKAWLLHTVSEPEVFSVDVVTHAATEKGAAAAKQATEVAVRVVRISDGDGEMTMHAILPERASVMKRGGEGEEFWTPGNASGGAWGSGRNWPMDPADGGALPTNAEEAALWSGMYGGKPKKLAKSNRVGAVPGAWRLEVTPLDAATDDVFLHAFEMGEKGKTGKSATVRVHGPGVEGALCGRMVALFVKAGQGQKSLQFKLPNEAMDAIWMRGLPAGLEIAVDFYDGTVPVGRMGGPLRTESVRTTPRGTVMMAGAIPAGARVSLRAGVV